MTPLYFVHSKFILHRIWPSWLLNKNMIFGKDPLICPPKIYSAENMAILTWADMIRGKPFYFVHPKFTLLCMSILTLEQILLWVLVLVLVLDMKVLDVLKYFLKKWVLDQYLYLVYIWGTWCTWVLGQLYLTPTLEMIHVSTFKLYVYVAEIEDQKRVVLFAQFNTNHKYYVTIIDVDDKAQNLDMKVTNIKYRHVTYVRVCFVG